MGADPPTPEGGPTDESGDAPDPPTAPAGAPDPARSGQHADRRVSPRVVLRIARWEVATAAGELDRRVVIATLLAVAALVGAGVATGGVTDPGRFDEGLYRVGIEESNILYPAVETDSTFRVREPSRAGLRDGQIDLLIEDRRIYGNDTPKARAAVGELRTAIVQYNDRVMSTEANASAAFPVTVELVYRSRPEAGIAAADGTGSDGPDTDAGAPPDGRDETPSGDEPPSGGGTPSGGDGTPSSGGTPSGGDGTPSSGGTPSGGDGTPSTPGPDGATDGERGGSFGGALPGGDAVGAPGTGPIFGGQSDGTPSGITPPFPFESLILAFLFVVPMNFVIQAYGSSILGERLERRGEPMLVAPVSRLDIVAGKTVPYLGVMLLVAAATAAAIGGGVVSVVAVAPLAALFLAATFLGAMFARSYRELTFVTVAVSTGLTAYAFVPAVFASIGLIGLISPLTLVVRDLQGTPISPLEFAFSTGPLTVTAAILFALGTSVYREEDMFTQRALSAKALDALARHVSGPRSVAVVSALSVPFVFVAELLTLALLVAIPVTVSIPILIACIVLVEEVAKSLPIYAGYGHDRFPARDRTAVVLGAASGVGFFVGEKGTLAAQLVGLTELTQGQAAFGPGASLPIPTPVLVLLPLGLHVGTTAVASLGARRGEVPYLVGLAAAIAIHATYNLTLLVISGVV